MDEFYTKVLYYIWFLREEEDGNKVQVHESLRHEIRYTKNQTNDSKTEIAT